MRVEIPKPVGHRDMTRCERQRRAHFAVLAVLTLALVMSAFAHRVSGYASGGQSLGFGALMPDGSFLVTCLSGEGGDQQGASTVCEFCHIAGSAGLPPSPELHHPVRFASISNKTVPLRLVTGPATGFPSAPLRGPPLFVV